MRTVGADVVFLQEVTGNHSKHPDRFDNYPDTPHYEFLADTIWPQFAYGRNAVYTNGHHGNAVMSKFPIVRFENRDVSISGPERRGLLHCELQIPGRSVNVHAICVHLGLMETHRAQQIAMLCDLVHKDIPAHAPVVVAGDFNDWRHRAHDLLEHNADLHEVFVQAYGKAARPFRRACRCCGWTAFMCATPSATHRSCCPTDPGRTCQTTPRWLRRLSCRYGPHACHCVYCAAPRGGCACLGAARRCAPWPPRLSLRVIREALQAAARETLRLCRLSKPAQAGLELQAPAPRGLCLLGAARRCAPWPPRWSLYLRLSLGASYEQMDQRQPVSAA
ncbi:endonuclease/exonuclease/phosphatase family protein [Polaromonas sp. P1-6]|nr:endonuclease/exonuclease/phosphatase family protein [Polaromonas sp. P1-6]